MTALDPAGSAVGPADPHSPASHRRTSNGGGKSKSLRRAGDWSRRAPLLPALVFLFAVTQLPFVATLVISFMDWQANRPDLGKSFAGVDNYKEVFTDPTLRSSVVETIVLTVSVVLISLVIGLGISLLLNRKFLGRGLVRTMMITPFLIVPAASALLWKYLLLDPSNGLINGVFTWLHLPQQEWMTTQPTAAIVAALVWQWTPFMMLILLAGLQSQPLDAIEAARVDGASPWQIFRYLTMPHMRRYLELGGLLGAIYIVQNFDAVFTMTAGGLGTENLPFSIYKIYSNAQDYGRSSAAGVVAVFFSIVIATFALRVVSSLFREEEGK